MNKVDLYFKYLNTYKHIQNNPTLAAQMKKDPGVRWYKRIHRIIWFVLYLLIVYGFTTKNGV